MNWLTSVIIVEYVRLDSVPFWNTFDFDPHASLENRNKQFGLKQLRLSGVRLGVYMNKY